MSVSVIKIGMYDYYLRQFSGNNNNCHLLFSSYMNGKKTE